MAFPPLVNSDHVAVSVSIGFLSSSKGDASTDCIAHDYFCSDWDNLCHHLRDVPWEDIFKLSASDAAASEFQECFKLKLVYLFLIINIRSSLFHLHGFQIFVFLP